MFSTQKVNLTSLTNALEFCVAVRNIHTINIHTHIIVFGVYNCRWQSIRVLDHFCFDDGIHSRFMHGMNEAKRFGQHVNWVEILQNWLYCCLPNGIQNYTWDTYFWQLFKVKEKAFKLMGEHIKQTKQVFIKTSYTCLEGSHYKLCHNNKYSCHRLGIHIQRGRALSKYKECLRSV